MILRRAGQLYLLVMLLSGLVIYGRGLASFFLADDFRVISAIRDGGPFAIRTFERGGFFRPLISLSFYADYSIWQLNPFGYHLTNLLFHAGNALLVAWLAWLLLAYLPTLLDYRSLIAGLAGILFFILPSHSEAVAWISGRTDLLATFFCLVSLCTYIVYIRSLRRSYLVISLIFYGIALLAKESVLPYPLIVAGYTLLHLLTTKNPGERIRLPARVFAGAALFWLVLAIYFAVRYLMIGTIAGGYGNDIHLRFAPHMLLVSIVSFSIRAILPPLATTTMAYVVFAGILLLGLLGAYISFVRRRQFPLLLVLLAAAFILTIIPVLTVGISLTDTQGERLNYFPTVFSTLLVVFFGALVLRQRHAFALVVVCLSLIWVTSLAISVRNWNMAGRLTQQILASMPAVTPGERLIILNLPDNLSGAYLFHISFDEVLHFMNGKRADANVIVASYHTISSKRDMVTVTEQASQFSIHLSNPKAAFGTGHVPLDPDEEPDDIDILALTSRSMSLMLEDVTSQDIIMYYSSGRLVPVRAGALRSGTVLPPELSPPHDLSGVIRRDHSGRIFGLPYLFRYRIGELASIWEKRA